MSTEHPIFPKRRVLLVMWSLANLVAWIVGLGLSTTLSSLISPLFSPSLRLIYWTAAGALAGFCFAVNHWVIFRPIRTRISHDWHKGWFIGTILGWALSLALLTGSGLSTRIGYPASGLILGLIVGLFQWLSIRTHIPHDWAWPAGHALIWMLAFTALTIDNLSLGFIGGGLVGSVLTGILFIYLIEPFRNAEAGH